MSFYQILNDAQAQVKDAWCEEIFSTYPLDTKGFLRRGKDEFANPVGVKTRKGVEELVDLLLKEEMDLDAMRESADEIVRVRAIQDFTPAQAMAVFFLLKSVVRKLFSGKPLGDELARELLQFESKIDSLALVAFDVYTQCVKQVYEMRVNEFKKSHHQLIRRAKMVVDSPAEEPETPHH